MNTTLQHIIDTVSGWEGIMPEPHRFGGTEFSLGRVEIGHVHQHGLVDVPFTKKLRDALVSEGAALPHHILRDSGWISFYIRKPEDGEQALRLMRLSYLHKRGRRERGFDAADELAGLGFAPAVNQAFRGHAADV